MPTLFERMHLLASGFVTPPAPPKPRRDHGGINDETARAKNRAWRPFKWWLQSKDAAHLAKVEADDVANQFPPLELWEVEQMIKMRIATLSKSKAAGKEPPPLI